MSSDELVVVTKRKTNKLCLDSEEEARLQAEQRQKQQQARLRKEQKRKRREQQARRIQQEAKKRLQQKQKYQNPQTMLLEDSDSGLQFQRVQKKIRRSYPDFKPKQEASKRRYPSQSSQSDDQSDDDSQSDQEQEEVPKKKKAEKKGKKQKKQKKVDHTDQIRQIKHKLQKVKIQEDDPKQKLIKQVAIRWWYCLPEWPPKDYPYEAQLKKLGYRLVEFSQFRMQQNLINGLYKVHPVEGYIGMFRSKLKIIDMRPNKENAPSLKFLRSKSQQQLSNLLRKALKQQHKQLSSQKYLLSQEAQLLTQIERRLKQLN